MSHGKRPRRRGRRPATAAGAARASEGKLPPRKSRVQKPSAGSERLRRHPRNNVARFPKQKRRGPGRRSGLAGILFRLGLLLALVFALLWGLWSGLSWTGHQLCQFFGQVFGATASTAKAETVAANPIRADRLLPSQAVFTQELPTPWGDAVQAPITSGWPRVGLAQTRLLPLPQTSPAQALQERFDEIALSYPDALISHVYFFDPQRLTVAELRADEAVPAASVIKLPLLFSAVQTQRRGWLDKNAHHPILPSNQVGGSGKWLFSPQGETHSLEETLEAMIQVSDNTATNMVIQQLGGLDAAARRLEHLGLPATRLNNWLPDLPGTNKISTKDMVRLLFNMQEGPLFTKEERIKVSDILIGTQNRRLIPEPLPADVVVAHKTGDIGSSLGDTAVLFLPDGRYYYLAVQIERPHNAPEAKAMIQAYSRAAYQYMTGQLPAKA